MSAPFNSGATTTGGPGTGGQIPVYAMPWWQVVTEALENAGVSPDALNLQRDVPLPSAGRRDESSEAQAAMVPASAATEGVALADSARSSPSTGPAADAALGSSTTVAPPAGAQLPTALEVLHPAARQIARRAGVQHATLASLADCVVGHGVCVTTACGRRYHGVLASVEDAEMTVVLEHCIQDKRSGPQAVGTVIIPGAKVVSLYPETTEPVPEPAVGPWGAGLLGAAPPVGSGPYGMAQAPPPPAYSPPQTPAAAAPGFAWQKQHHAHMLLVSGVISQRTGKRRLGAGGAAMLE